MTAKAAALEPRSPRALARDPLTVDDILTGFYRPDRRPPDSAEEGDVEAPAAVHETAPIGAATVGAEPAVAEEPAKKPRPTHYKLVCISLYTEDIERLDSLVAQLKRRGHTKANKSQVIREALLQIDLDKVPRSH